MMRLPINPNIGLPEKPVNGTSNEVNGENVVSMASIDLFRGESLGLPCGIQTASSVLNENVLALDDFDLFKPKAEDGGGLPNGSFTDVPFLLYILQEARSQNSGERLGEFGGRIQGEVILGLLERDSKSILNRKVPWRSPITCQGSFTMVDLINFVEGSLVPANCSIPKC